MRVLDVRRPPETRGQYALDSLREALNEGRLEPGQHLNAEDLSLRLGVSHIPIREALRFLEAQGLLERDTRGRVHVPQLSVEEVEEIYRVRDLLEDSANDDVVSRITTSDIEAMEADIATMEVALAASDYPTYSRANREFHFIPLRRAGGRWRLRFLELLWDGAARYQSALVSLGSTETIQSHHRELLDAYRAHDASAVSRLMRDHRALTVDATRSWVSAAVSEAHVQPAGGATAPS